MRLTAQIRTLALFAAAASAALAGTPSPDPAEAVVAKYQEACATALAEKLRADLSRVSEASDPAEVEGRVRREFGDLVLDDPRFTRLVWEIVEPVFRFAGKERTCRLLILKTADPIAFVDDGCVVVVSTGMLMAANSEDAICGVVAHEQAHSLFAARTASARGQLAHAQRQGDRALEERALASINLIEYECDAVAAIQLSATGYNPLRYLELLDAANLAVRIVGGVAQFQPGASTPEHEARKRVVTRLASPAAANAVHPTNRLLPLQAAIRRARGGE